VLVYCFQFAVLCRQKAISLNQNSPTVVNRSSRDDKLSARSVAKCLWVAAVLERGGSSLSVSNANNELGKEPEPKKASTNTKRNRRRAKNYADSVEKESPRPKRRKSSRHRPVVKPEK